MKIRIKKNDEVQIIAGNSKGKKGKVLKVFPDTMRLIVEGVNVRKRHVRPTQANPKGGIIEKEMPISLSNVMIVDPKSGEPTRIGSKIVLEENTGKKKISRVAVKSGEMIK